MDTAWLMKMMSRGAVPSFLSVGRAAREQQQQQQQLLQRGKVLPWKIPAGKATPVRGVEVGGDEEGLWRDGA